MRMASVGGGVARDDRDDFEVGLSAPSSTTSMLCTGRIVAAQVGALTAYLRITAHIHRYGPYLETMSHIPEQRAISTDNEPYLQIWLLSANNGPNSQTNRPNL